MQIKKIKKDKKRTEKGQKKDKKKTKKGQKKDLPFDISMVKYS